MSSAVAEVIDLSARVLHQLPESCECDLCMMSTAQADCQSIAILLIGQQSLPSDI